MQRYSDTKNPQSLSQGKRWQVLFSTGKMALATLSSRILGLLRELTMAAVFGASGTTDAFLVAFRIPNILRDLLAEGAFSSAFVPTFTEVRQRDPEEAKELLWSLFFILTIISTILGIGYAYFAPQLIRLFAPEFINDPTKFGLSVDLLRLMSPFLLCTTIAALFMGTLNSLKFFFTPSMAPTVSNFFMTITIVTLTAYVEKLGYPGVYTMAIGVLLGGVSQVLLQVPPLFKTGHGPRIPRTLLTPAGKKVIMLLGPGIIGMAATQINILVTTGLASAYVGAVSWLNYAFRLFQFPVGILSVSIAGSNLVHFSDAWKANLRQEAKDILHLSHFFSWLTIVPCMALLYALAPQTVHLVLERGKFSANDTLMTASSLRFYTLGLPSYGLYKIFVPVFYAIDKQMVPIIISLICIGFNIVFCLLLSPHYGFEILPLGTSLSISLNVIFLCVYLKKYIDLPLSFFFNLRLFKVFLAGIVCYLSTYFFCQYFFDVHWATLKKVIAFILIGLGGASSYAIILIASGEKKDLTKIFKRKKV